MDARVTNKVNSAAGGTWPLSWATRWETPMQVTIENVVPPDVRLFRDLQGRCRGPMATHETADEARVAVDIRRARSVLRHEVKLATADDELRSLARGQDVGEPRASFVAEGCVRTHQQRGCGTSVQGIEGVDDLPHIIRSAADDVARIVPTCTSRIKTKSDGHQRPPPAAGITGQWIFPATRRSASVSTHSISACRSWRQ